MDTTTKAPGQKKKANMKKGGHARKKPIKLIEKIVRTKKNWNKSLSRLDVYQNRGKNNLHIIKTFDMG